MRMTRLFAFVFAPANSRLLPAIVTAIALAGPAAYHALAAEAGGEPEKSPAPLTRLEVFPPALEFTRPAEVRAVTVTGHYADGRVADLTRAAELRVPEGSVAAVEAGRIAAVGDGTSDLLISVGGRTARVPIRVSGQDETEVASFRYGALVALSKHDCNSGACHGSPSGKNGFRLSLRAYDPVLDEYTLTREEYGRRTNPANPEASLLLQKPLMEVAHAGGQRLRKSDPGYQLLRDWIAQGGRPDPPETAECVRLEIFPRERVLHWPDHAQQMIALAHFSDGSARDVTRLVIYSSSDEAIAKVDAEGLVTAEDKGEAAVLVRYLDKLESAHFTFLKETPGFAWPNPPTVNYVDELVWQKLQLLQIPPAERSTDDEFVRRVYLDVLGILPPVDEAAAFLADPDPEKRGKLIDRLLERPEYASFWALKWGDLLRLNSKQLSAAGVPKFHDWLVAAVRDNRPYDQFVRELLTATGSTFANPPANYFRALKDTSECTETTAQVFLGIRMQCAKCHNHPFERWTQDNYYGIGAFFNRVQRKQNEKRDEMIVFASRSGEVIQPRTGKQMAPWLPLAGTAEIAPEADRREAFADWLARPDNPFFARVEVNRIWAHVMGRGIVEPVDDFRDSNPPSNAELLDALAADFVRSGFDRKHILRTILNSHTYQLSYRTSELNRADTKYFSHARTRLLSAEQLLDAICQVTGVSESYAGLPAGTRATQLASPDVEHAFLKVFGQPARETACQCERATETNLSQALQMINGPTVHAKLRDEHNRFRRLATDGKSDEEIVRELFMAAYCRPPEPAELETAVAYLAGANDRLRGLEDLCWTILNSKEFLFQH